MRRLVYFVVPWLCLAQACATGRGVRPVGAGKAAFGVSVGGPIINNLKAPVPLPITAATMRAGLTERTDIDAAIYLPISRSVGADVGAAHLLWQQKKARPAVMVGLRLLSFVAWPQLGQRRRPHPRLFLEGTLRASWATRHFTGRPGTAPGDGPSDAPGPAKDSGGPAGLAFVGFDALGQAHAPGLSPQVSVGYQGRVSRRWTLHAELRWLAFNRDPRALTVRYAGLGRHGSVGLQLGASYTFALHGEHTSEVPPPQIQRELP